MLRYQISLLIALLCFSFSATAQNSPQDQQKSQEEMLQQEVERLERTLNLEYWQVFYVDSILHHNSAQMMQEIQAMQHSRVENTDLYSAVQDKWVGMTQEAYRKIFTESQWKTYLSQGGEKIIREREKRQKKTLEATNGKQKRSEKKN